MKKILIGLFFICAIFACKKNETASSATKCYHCYSVASGINVSKDTCTNEPLNYAIPLFDANGNPLNVICVEK